MIRGDYHTAQRAYDNRMPPPDEPELPAEFIDEAKDRLMNESIYDFFWRLGRYETGVVGGEFFTERNRQDCAKAIEMLDKAVEMECQLHAWITDDGKYIEKTAAMRENELVDFNIFDLQLLIDGYAKGDSVQYFTNEDREFFADTVRLLDECIDMIAEWYAYIKSQNYGKAPKTAW